MFFVDIIIVLFLLSGALIGFKRGIFKSVITFCGTIIIIVIAWSLKNPVSSFMWTNLPFFKLGGLFKGIEVINILIYELIAFLLIFSILFVLLKIIIKITGIFELVLKMTIVLSIPSKILGAIFGFLESYLYLFMILLGLNAFALSIDGLHLTESKLVDYIIYKTPFLSPIFDEGTKSLQEIYDLKDKYDNSNNEEFNDEAIKILIKYGILSKENILKLEEQGKIKIKDKEILK